MLVYAGDIPKRGYVQGTATRREDVQGTNQGEKCAGDGDANSGSSSDLHLGDRCDELCLAASQRWWAEVLEAPESLHDARASPRSVDR